MRFIVLLALMLVSDVGAAPKLTLPDKLDLEYSLSYGSIELGRAMKHLERRANGVYMHSTSMRPSGIVRAFTNVEWYEEGEFAVKGDELRPLRFTEIRRGDSRAYEHTARFDWTTGKVNFNDGRQAPIYPGIQDQGSIIFSFMLRPLNNGERTVMVTNGKDLDPYKLVFMGWETLHTPVGTFDTAIIKRLSQKQVALEEECKKQHKSPDDCPVDDFTAWVAPAKGNIAVKLQQRRKNQTLTLVLRSISGL